jgi:acyl-homoserine-lactone acylase
VLDGSRSACGWGRDPDAVVSGIFGPGRLPVRYRPDFVTNSNDSHWMSNPAQPLTGFDRIIGDEGTERSLRTRLGIRMAQQRLAGVDGLPGRRFTPARLRTVVFNNRNYGGELVLADLVRLCEAHPSVRLRDGTTVALQPACSMPCAAGTPTTTSQAPAPTCSGSSCSPGRPTGWRYRSTRRAP